MALVACALATAFLLAPLQIVAPYPMLLAERFARGAGWVEIAAVALYAAWICGRLLDPERQSGTRKRVWLLFSAVFYLQLVLGLAGVRPLLMAGALHVPVPALIVAGPIYRGEGLFMPILFVATVILVGPAWCSHLCYVGAWDAYAGGLARPLRSIGPARRLIQIASLGAVAAAAVLLRVLRAPGLLATGLGIGFGVAGVGVMLLVSRRNGTMAHCTAWCPIGILSTTLGKLSPWRVRVAPECTGCGRCLPACRYNALDMERIRAGSPGASCTLCGDCVTRCRDGALVFSLYGHRARSPERVRTAFTVAVTVLHALFLAVARV